MRISYLTQSVTIGRVNKLQQTTKLLSINMDDNDRIVYPDEVEDAKAEADEKTKGGDSNSIEEAPPIIQPRNMITVPPNCPPGYQMMADGVCREVMK